MAAVIFRSGRWWVKFYDSAGRQKWVKGYTSEQATRDMADRLEDEKTAIRNGDLDPSIEHRRRQRSRPVAQHIEDYRTHLEAAGRSSNHVAYTIADIKACFAHAAVTHAGQLTRQHVDAWVLSCRQAADAPRTINRRIGSVQAFCKWLTDAGGVDRYLLHKYPKQRVLGTEKRKRRALDPAEALKLLTATPEPRRLVYRFALRTGFRHGEVASMTPANFDFTLRTVTVWAADAKNKRRHQTIPMHPELVQPLQALCQGKARDQRIFDMATKDTAAQVLRADCQAAGVDPTHVDFHGLRHSFISQLAQAGVHPVVLQKLARHADVSTTLSYYTHMLPASDAEAIGRLGGEFIPTT